MTIHSRTTVGCTFDCSGPLNVCSKIETLSTTNRITGKGSSTRSCFSSIASCLPRDSSQEEAPSSMLSQATSSTSNAVVDDSKTLVHNTSPTGASSRQKLRRVLSTRIKVGSLCDLLIDAGAFVESTAPSGAIDQQEQQERQQERQQQQYTAAGYGQSHNNGCRSAKSEDTAKHRSPRGRSRTRRPKTNRPFQVQDLPLQEDDAGRMPSVAETIKSLDQHAAAAAITHLSSPKSARRWTPPARSRTRSPLVSKQEAEAAEAAETNNGINSSPNTAVQQAVRAALAKQLLERSPSRRSFTDARWNNRVRDCQSPKRVERSKSPTKNKAVERNHDGSGVSGNKKTTKKIRIRSSKVARAKSFDDMSFDESFFPPQNPSEIDAEKQPPNSPRKTQQQQQQQQWPSGVVGNTSAKVRRTIVRNQVEQGQKPRRRSKSLNSSCSGHTPPLGFWMRIDDNGKVKFNDADVVAKPLPVIQSGRRAIVKDIASRWEQKEMNVSKSKPRPPVRNSPQQQQQEQRSRSVPPRRQQKEVVAHAAAAAIAASSTSLAVSADSTK